jgi:hypothetical protein
MYQQVAFSALKPWEVYLLPKEIIVYSDRQNLKHLEIKNHVDHMLERCATYLEV